MSSVEAPYEVEHVPLGTHRPIRVVCIGAGYSGLMMSIIAKERMQHCGVDFRVYEKNTDLGGTWLLNRYPGCQCDIPSHNYAYSFDPNPDWPGYYASSEQIFDYMKQVSKRHGCDDLFAYGHEVVSAKWDDVAGVWNLVVKADGVELDDYCHVLINASGVLKSVFNFLSSFPSQFRGSVINWKWPNIPGIETYQGKLMHSAEWDTSYDYSGKRLAVIGIGSSGIQILPQVTKAANHIDYFIRSQTWISPARGINEAQDGDPELDEQYNYVSNEIKRFHEDPEYLLGHRKALSNRRIDEFRASLAGPEVLDGVKKSYVVSMLERLGKGEKGQRLASLIIPEFPVGCRRLTPGQGFLEAMVRENVDTHWNDLDRITGEGIILRNGRTLLVDAIICATGFDTTFKPRFPIIGQNGVNLAEKWDKEDPDAYFGITVPQMPNYFCFIGPNSPVSNGSLVQAIQMTGVYIYNCIKKLQTQGVKSMTVTEEAVADLNEHSQAWLKDTVWAAPCRSWYKRGTTDGRIVGLYAGSCYHFAEALRHPRWEDYNLEYLQQNRFHYLGNGLTLREQRKEEVSDTQTLDFDSYWRLFILPDIHT
ncbi:hypothetical protein BGW36DRAFT_450673 [Talaromyces proteolyticus]|uniref:Uncharacterized protein n=1 Tax=Talaromyces proteolyticus TaxID=1131652 RepID=A0AAD4KQC3_9EURO|nr:uncharacterized protein BGW36DRAFT_450673 [Talaromyces proteolyticus]KAH8697928.1 hypothetical protein BGW36DRAFT_450673 [Talaromyces proteolyticus]